MLRGEFRFQNGLIVPNNITQYGAAMILAAALRNTVPTFWVGLCNAVFEPDLRIESDGFTEPTLAVGGYARMAVARSAVGWPGGGLVNGESYLESLSLVWAAVAVPYDEPVTRMFLTPEQNALAGEVYALSGALPEEFEIDPATPEPDRTFKYRIYLR